MDELGPPFMETPMGVCVAWKGCFMQSTGGNAIPGLIKSELESAALDRFTSVATLVIRGWWIRSRSHICPPCLCVIPCSVGFCDDFWSSMRRWLLGLSLGCPDWSQTKQYCMVQLFATCPSYMLGKGCMFRPRYWCRQSYCLRILMDCHGNRLG